LLGACAQDFGFNTGGASSQEEQPRQKLAFTRFPDLPMPSGAEINLDQTLVFGSSDAWFGRLVLSSSLTGNQLFDFFKNQVPGFGWDEITSVRAAISVLTYSRQRRVATIQLQGDTITGTTIIITVSPREAAGSALQPGAAPRMGAPVRKPPVDAAPMPIQPATPGFPPIPDPVLRAPR